MEALGTPERANASVASLSILLRSSGDRSCALALANDNSIATTINIELQALRICVLVFCVFAFLWLPDRCAFFDFGPRIAQANGAIEHYCRPRVAVDTIVTKALKL